jgi:putative transcriptional regulator
MSPQHHPDEEILCDHAMGRLTRGQGLVIEAHLAHCPLCRADVDGMEAVGGALLESLPEAQMDVDAFAKVMARVDAPEPPVAEPQPPKRVLADLQGVDVPAVLGAAPVGRKRWLAPGVWMRPVLSEQGGQSHTYLLRGAPGMQLITHGHTGREFTTVLKGAYSEATGRYGAGDFQFADQALDHGPFAEPGEECICLISAEGPMAMHGLIGKLMQPFIRL